jgi:hypothetical protein
LFGARGARAGGQQERSYTQRWILRNSSSAATPVTLCDRATDIAPTKNPLEASLPNFSSISCRRPIEFGLFKRADLGDCWGGLIESFFGYTCSSSSSPPRAQNNKHIKVTSSNLVSCHSGVLKSIRFCPDRFLIITVDH